MPRVHKVCSVSTELETKFFERIYLKFRQIYSQLLKTTVKQQLVWRETPILVFIRYIR